MVGNGGQVGQALSPANDDCGIQYSMFPISRRDFNGALLLGAQAGNLLSAATIDETLRASARRRKVPALVAMAATAERTIYSGALGQRDSASNVEVTTRSIFRIASMTKAVTTVAALQLVEHGKLTLDEPVAAHLPELGKLKILEGFDQAGRSLVRPASEPVTLRRLLTHTSGFAYERWNPDLRRHSTVAADSEPRAVPPLMTEPGTRWEYGTSLDWTGRLVEAVSGQTLEVYFQRNILGPLGMQDTGFTLPAEKFDRLVSSWQRQSDGSFTENPRKPPEPPKSFNGGGGLYSTAPDYVRFMQMILRRGKTGDNQPILGAESVDMMSSNQIGELSAGNMKSVEPAQSSDVDFHPGFRDKFSFGFLINTAAYEGGRSAGSLAWAGLLNTFFWIDPKRQLCAVLLMQFLPFCDAEAVGLLGDFERAVYT